MLTSVQVAHARRFAVSPRGGFSIPDVERLRARVVATLESYEGTGLPGRDGLTAAALSGVVLPSVFAQPGYPMLDVQDFLDEVHEALATLEQRGTFPAPVPALVPASADAPGFRRETPTSWMPAVAAQVPSVRSAQQTPARTDVMPAVRTLASVGAPAVAPSYPRPATATAATAPAPARAYGMDADALVFELQSAVAQSRARGALQVSVQVPGQNLRVMRVVETSPGHITIVAQ